MIDGYALENQACCSTAPTSRTSPPRSRAEKGPTRSNRELSAGKQLMGKTFGSLLGLWVAASGRDPPLEPDPGGARELHAIGDSVCSRFMETVRASFISSSDAVGQALMRASSRGPSSSGWAAGFARREVEGNEESWLGRDRGRDTDALGLGQPTAAQGRTSMTGHAARSRGDPEDPRAPGPRLVGAEPRARPARVRRRRVLSGSSRARGTPSGLCREASSVLIPPVARAG